MKNFGRLLKLGLLEKRLSALLFIFAALNALLEAFIPLIIKFIFDLLERQAKTGFGSFDVSELAKYLVLFIVVTFSGNLVDMFEEYYGSKWWHKIGNTVTQKVFDHLTTLSNNFYEGSSTGRLIERLGKGISDIQDILGSIISSLVPQIIYIFIAMFFLFSINITFGLIVMVGIPLFVVSSVVFYKALNSLQEKVRNAAEKATIIKVETISNIKTVKSFATEDRHSKQLKKYLAEELTTTIQRNKKRFQMSGVRYTITDISQLLILAFGAYWAATGKITIGTLVMAWMYVNRVYSPLWYLTRIYDNIQRDMISVSRVFDILDTELEIKDKKGAISLEKVKGAIELKNISFKYKKRNVIKNLDLMIPAGKVVAIVGKSGVGKSTIAKLLMRFYDPQVGSVYVDGHDVRDVTQKSLRENIGVVLQDTAIFNDTAFNNIAYAKPKSSKEDVIKAAKTANAYEFIMNLTEGYDTVVGERGVRLSGGEQQRINIARAVLKNPPILVFDEATSHLDSESEKLIQDALWKLIKGRTSVIIAHRLSTIMKADLIVVLDKGKISEIGTHSELLKKEGIYHKLFKIQSGGYLK
jgi:subfamily B ATP-binding cassette protein MsbA